MHRTLEFKWIILSVFVLLIIFFSVGCQRKTGNEKGKKIITIGSKHFTEQEILGEILSLLIEEHTDIKVVKKLTLGGTMVCFNALRKGDIDLYPEYTGTGLVNILDREAVKDPDEAYEIVKKQFFEKFDLTWLKPFGFNNAYTLTMRAKHAEALGIKTISDLVHHQNELQPGFDAEFFVRSDGYPGLKKRYGLYFKKNPRQMVPGIMYKALAEKSVDVICGYTTDGRIPAYDLVILEDDKNFFPPYYAAPLIRRDTLLKYPELKEVLNKIGGVIDNQRMQKLNYEVDKKEKSASVVAQEFLEEKGLIPTH